MKKLICVLLSVLMALTGKINRSAEDKAAEDKGLSPPGSHAPYQK